MSYAGVVDSVVAGIVQGAIYSNSAPPPRYYGSGSYHHKHKSKRRSKKKSNYPKNCSSEKWVSQSINNSMIATNYKGITVDYDKMGDLEVRLDVKNPLPSIFKPGDLVHATVSFNNGKREINAKLDKDAKTLIATALDAIYLSNKLKSASYVKVKFANNEYCTRLKGSSSSIKIVETAASLWQKNKPDAVNEARISRAVTEHKEHAMRIASNQLEFSQKVQGIRPKSDLEKYDRNIYPTKIQYYKPGSEEIGEMWVDWYIDDKYGPTLTLNFMDPEHPYEKKTHVIKVSLLPIDKQCNTDLSIKSDESTSPSCKIVKDLLHTDQWGKIAKEKELRRQYTKRVSYIRGDNNSSISLSVLFKIYEDGAMAAQIEEKKFKYPYQFNFTLANALELAKYIEKSRKKARQKWMNKTRTKEDLDALFD